MCLCHIRKCQGIKPALVHKTEENGNTCCLVYSLYNIKCIRCSSFLSLGSLIWYSSRQLHPWNTWKKVSLWKARREVVFFEAWFLYNTSSSRRLCFAVSLRAISAVSESWGDRGTAAKCSQSKRSLALIFWFLPISFAGQTSLFCPQTGMWLPDVLCSPWYTSSHRVYFCSSWILSFKDAKLKLQALEVHLPWCFCCSVVQQMLLGFVEPYTQMYFREHCHTLLQWWESIKLFSAKENFPEQVKNRLALLSIRLLKSDQWFGKKPNNKI